MDLAGGKTPGDVDGVSLRPALEGKPQETRPVVFTRGYPGLVATSADWTLLYPSGGLDPAKPDAPASADARRDPIQLFRIKDDPLQQNNVLAANKSAAHELLDAYDAFLDQKGVGDPKQRAVRP